MQYAQLSLLKFFQTSGAVAKRGIFFQTVVEGRKESRSLPGTDQISMSELQLQFQHFSKLQNGC